MCLCSAGARDADARLRDPRTAANRTPARLSQLFLAKAEPTLTTTCRLNRQTGACGSQASLQVRKVIGHVPLRHIELRRQFADCHWILTQQ
jgi:hypothetical protein